MDHAFKHKARKTTGGNDVALAQRPLTTPGKALDTGTRRYMERRFGHDFSRVQVHADSEAAASARAVDALAYTVGQDIVFAQDRYRPETPAGRALLFHELVHTVQQEGMQTGPGVGSPDVVRASDGIEQEARAIGRDLMAGGSVAPIPIAPVRGSAPIIARGDPAAVEYTMRLGVTPRTGLQFWPTNVVDTRVGPVSVRGGLLSDRASRLNVIIGENMTMRMLAQQLLPLWTTATPFTPAGAAAPLPLDIISVDELAKALMFYNQTYLPVPSLRNWRSGLRFPLPVEIDETTGIATLHPLQIRALATGFDPVWTPLLTMRAPATATPPAAPLTADVTAFLAEQTDSLARGIHLGARAVTNARSELPFIRETFRQLGAGAFEVALSFMDNLVNREISLLAAQRDGAAILGEIRTALAAAPAAPTAAQQASLARANRMLGLVAGVAGEAPAGAARNRPEKTVTIDTVKLDGSNHTPSAGVAVANGIFSQCNIRLVQGVDATATNAETTGWLGGNTDLHASGACGSISVEERRLWNGAAARFGLAGRLRAFYPATYSGTGGTGYSYPPYCATGPASVVRGMIVLSNNTTREDLAHEIGHILLNSGTHPALNLMSPYGGRNVIRLTDTQCTHVYNNV